MAKDYGPVVIALVMGFQPTVPVMVMTGRCKKDTVRNGTRVNFEKVLLNCHSSLTRAKGASFPTSPLLRREAAKSRLLPTSASPLIEGIFAHWNVFIVESNVDCYNVSRTFSRGRRHAARWALFGLQFLPRARFSAVERRRPIARPPT